MRTLLARLTCYLFGHRPSRWENLKVRRPNRKLPKRGLGRRYFWRCDRCDRGVPSPVNCVEAQPRD